MSENLSRRWATRGRLAALAGAVVVSLGCAAGADVVGYDMPAEAGQYTLEVEVDGVTTEWTYTSVRPTADASEDLPPCTGEMLQLPGEEEPCRAEPLIFLRYDLGLDVDNTLPAGRHQKVEITGFYQQLESPPEVTELTLEATFDGGETWQAFRTRNTGENTFTATIRHPRLEETNGAVGLRVTATDNQGNSVVQTAPRVYGLR